MTTSLQLFVRVKQVGKRKPIVENQPLEMTGTVRSLRELLTEIVRQRVEAFNERTEAGNWTKYLTDFDIEATAESGKVGFDAKYNGKVQNAEKAIDTALVAFGDGLFRVFLGGNEIESLDTPLTLKNGDVLTFIRLTMLAGRTF
ncbi:MAG: hypothetical protein LBU65_13175 [Planctomycetaceae bacterium]|jgi:hypothetical protein|nr:hypothetical protein [Planctomycetaceae bacterium]